MNNRWANNNNNKKYNNILERILHCVRTQEDTQDLPLAIRDSMCLGIVFPGGTVVKNPPANARDERYAGSIPGFRRSPE